MGVWLSYFRGTLIGAGIDHGWFRNTATKIMGEKILMAALGMAIYSEINSPGYFAQLGQWALVAMFEVLLFGAILSVILLLKQGEHK